MGQTGSRPNRRGGGGSAFQQLRLSGWQTEPGATPIKAPTLTLTDGTHITLENLCALYAAASSPADTAKCLQIIECNFDRLLHTKERRHSFFLLSKDALISILRSDDLHCNNEYRLLLLVGAWADAQLEVKHCQEIAEETKKGSKENTGNSYSDVGEGPTDIDLRGTAGFFQQMTQGAMKHMGMSEEEEAALIQDLLAEDDQPTTSAAQNTDDSTAVESVVIGLDTENFEDMLGEDEMGGILNTDGVDVPKWKLSQAYQDQLRAIIADFCPFIRFPLMSARYLQYIEEEGFVPHSFCHEALRYQALSTHLDEKEVKELKKNCERFRSRGVQFVPLWDPTKKDPRLNLSSDHKTVTVQPGSGCAHKAIIGKHAIYTGQAAWEITLNQTAGCYDAVGVVSSKFKHGQDMVIGVQPNSWGISLYSGTHVTASNRRLQVGTGQMQAGTKIRIKLDADIGAIEFLVNGASKGKMTGVTGHGQLYPAMTLCEMTGNGHTIKPVPYA